MIPAQSAADDVVPPPSRRFETLVALGVLLALLMGALDQFVALTALPTILSQFHAPSDGGTFVISAYVIASTTAIPIFAKLSDIWSRRNVFLSGLAIFIVGSILSGLSQNLSELIVFRAVQGFGSGDFFPVGIAIIAVTFPPQTRARVIGALSGVFGIAVVAGPLLGSSILNFTNNDWRWLFYVNIPVGVVGFFIIASTLGPLLPEKVRRFDIAGAALLAGWVAALMLPLYLIADSGWSWTDPRVLGLLIGAAVLVVAFILWELRVDNPLVPLQLLSHRVMAAAGGATFFIGLTFFPLATFLSLVVGEVLAPHGSNIPNIVRDMLYALVIPLVIGAALGGQLLTRLTYRTVSFVGILFALVGMVGIADLSTSTPLWVFTLDIIPVGGVVLPLIPLGFGIGLTFPVFLLAAQNQVSKADVGEAGGMIQFLQSLGGAIGLSTLASFQETRFTAMAPASSTACASAGAPTASCLSYLSSVESALITSYDQTFDVMVALLVVALVFVLFLRGRLPKGASPGPSAAP
ncbi:MAG: MFS transporter [Thermoplasmata archaeon]